MCSGLRSPSSQLGLSPEEFRSKCIRMVESYGWNLLGVERANPVPEDGEFSEDVEDMLERTKTPYRKGPST